MKNYRGIKLLALALGLFAVLLTTGCAGTNFVAANHDLGVAATKKTTMCVSIPSIYINEQTDPAYNTYFTNELAEFIISTGGAAKALDLDSSPEAKHAVDSYLHTKVTSGFGNRDIGEATNFGSVANDFARLGCDGLMVVAGGGTSPGWNSVVGNMVKDGLIHKIAYGTVTGTMFMPTTAATALQVSKRCRA